MTKPLIIANWKANKTLAEAKSWAEELVQNWPTGVEQEVILAPSFPHLSFFRQFLNEKNLPLKLCAQDVSRFPQGPYTGEVAAESLIGLADYVLIGHSERRNNFQESDGILKEKVERAKSANLKVIYCISEKDVSVPSGVSVIGYEPLFAIGSGQPDTPQNANHVAEGFKNQLSLPVVYGGSVKPDNAQSFMQEPNLDGLLVGGASLKASEFLEILKNAA